MAKQRQQPESFDVAEFLRPTDDDLRSALSSLLRDGNAFDSQSNEAKPEAATVPISTSTNDLQSERNTILVKEDTISELPSDSLINNASALTAGTVSSKPLQTAEKAQIKPEKGVIALIDQSFDLPSCINKAKVAYRLNHTELILYEMFLNWTHAIGKTRCETTNRKICEVSGLIEKTVRRNLKSLRARGLIMQVKDYDPYTHEPAIFDVTLPPSAPSF
jgi:hypothetical protein